MYSKENILYCISIIKNNKNNLFAAITVQEDYLMKTVKVNSLFEGVVI